MANKITDITKRIEDPESEEKRPEIKREVPVRVEIEKKMEAPKPAEVPQIKIETKPEEAPVYQAPVPSAQPAKSPVLEKIENVLEEDLQDIYFQLPPEKQAEFAKSGEETANQIAGLVQEAKIRVKKILELIIKWLKMIPGVNKYFLEQEAKIKTDKILELRTKGEVSSTFEDKNKI